MNQFEPPQASVARWTPEYLKTLANGLAAKMMLEPGEWDPPLGIEPKRETLFLSVGIPDSGSLPRPALNDAMQKVLAENGDASLRYGFGPGYFPLRAAIVARYREQHASSLTEDWLQLTNGSSAAIDLLVRALIEPGDVIISESPAYMGSLRNFRGVGARIVPVATDAEGLRIDVLETVLTGLARERARVKFIYTISSFQNPTGATLSLPRRKALLALAAKHGCLILDDEAYADLYYESAPLPSLLSLSDGYGVASVGTFSKTIATGLRVGWVMARPEVLSMITRMRFDMGQNQMGLRMMANFLRADALEPHVERMRALYRDKMNTLADALRAQCGDHLTFTRPQGGFYLWVRLRDGLLARDVWRAAFEEGVAINPGDGFRVDRNDPGEYLRIAFAWTPREQIPEAARRIGIACRRAATGDVP
jgi:2-aminoadipate transaminase